MAFHENKQEKGSKREDGSTDHSTQSIPLETLQKRVADAEGRTQNLVRRLADLGFPFEPTKTTKTPILAEINGQTLTHFENRLEKTENALDALKWSVDLLQKEKQSQKPVDPQQSSRLGKELKQTKSELLDAKSAQGRLERQVEKLTSALDIATSNKMGLLNRVEDLKGGRQRAVNKVAEVKGQLEREMKARASLEESHNCFLEKIQCVDGVVDLARRDVKSLTRDSELLRKELIKGRKELEIERERRKEAEMQAEQWKASLTARGIQVENLEKNNLELTERMSELQKSLKKAQNGRRKDAEKITVLEADAVKLRNELDFIRRDRESVEEQKRDVDRRLDENESGRKKAEEELSEMVRHLEMERDEAAKSALHLQEEVTVLRDQVGACQSEKEAELNHLQEMLQAAVEEKNQVMAMKEDLLEEVNQAIDGMAKERDLLNAHIEQLKVDLEEAGSHSSTLEGEVHGLRELQNIWQSRSQEKLALEALKVEMTSVKLERDRLAGDYKRVKAKLDKEESFRSEYREKAFTAEKSCRVLEEDNSRLAESLESLMGSNQELQTALLSLKGELEKKMEALASAGEMKALWESSLSRLQSEVERLQGQLIEAEKKVPRESVRVAERVTKAWEENLRLKGELEKWESEVKRMESDLVMLRKANEEMERKGRLDLVEMEEEWKAKGRQSAAKLKAALQENRKLAASLRDLQCEHESSLTVKARLESKASSLETGLARMKREVLALKGQVTNARRDLQKAEEKIVQERESRSRKGDASDPAKLRKNLEVMGEAQRKAGKRLEEQATELQRLKSVSSKTEERLRLALVERDEEIKRIQMVTNRKVEDALDESSLASFQLQEVRESYECQLAELTSELAQAKEVQAGLERRIAEQQGQVHKARVKANLQSQKAQEIVKASRLMISKVASQAENDQRMAKGNLDRIKSRLQLERELSSHTAQKYQHLKVTSALRCHELARELSEIKIQKSPPES
eukprot:m.101022 g.101022  ORF g.101022 m.101022 type:complete len:981 (+) comp37110_c0_seq5:102-3044(+)